MSDDKAQARALRALEAFRDALSKNLDTDIIEDKFTDALDEITDAQLQTKLERAFQELNNTAANRLFQKYAEITARFNALQDGFNLGARVAEAGKKSLFFPAAAAYLGQVEGIVEELKEAAKTVKNGADEIKEGVASAEDAFAAEDVEGLIDAATNIKNNFEGLIETFGNLKDTLSA